jgi:hypothetical protein
MNSEKEKNAFPGLRDLVSGCILLVFSFLCWFWLIPYRILDPVMAQRTVTSGKNPRIFPQICVLLLFSFSLFLLGNYFFHYRLARKTEKAENNRRGKNRKILPEYWDAEKGAIAGIIMLIIYAILITRLGFIVSSLIMAAGINWHLGARGWKAMFLGPFILTGVIYLVFTFWLNVSFPKGLLI